MFSIHKLKNKAQDQILELTGKHQKKIFDSSGRSLDLAKKIAPEKLKSYLKSHLFEDDLDQFLEILNISNRLEDFKKFEIIEDHSERLLAKTKHLKSQMAVFVTALSAMGSEAAIMMSGNALMGFVVGTAVGVFIILFVAGGIVIRRAAEASDIVDIVPVS